MTQVVHVREGKGGHGRGARGRVLPWVGILVLIAGVGLGACGRRPLPAVSATVDAPLLRPGSSWTYKVQDSGKPEVRTVTFTFEKEDVFKDASVLVFRVGRETIYLSRDLAFVAEFRDDRPLLEAQPSLRQFDFPFYVDKEWNAVFSYQDHERSLSWVPVEVRWKVEEYEVVKLPAGEFRAFRLKGRPRTNWASKEEVWYAPEVRFPVKRTVERDRGHYLGAGTETWELVQFTLK